MKTPVRKILLIFVLVTAFSSLSAQQTALIIQGNVYNLNNQPIAGKQVQLMVDSMMGPLFPVSYTSIVFTDVNGFFVDTVMIPNSTVAAMVLAVVYDCINVPQYNFQWYYPLQPLPLMNFTICDSAATTNCSANFLAGTSPNSLTVNFTDMSTPSAGSSTVSWLWSFGDSVTSVLQNPVHTYTQAGVYQVCLSITDSLLCSSTSCQPVVVPGATTGWCSAGFTAIPIGGTTSVSFINISQSQYGPALHNTDYLWSMGDGTTITTTTLTPFVHTYPATGNFQPCVTIIVTDMSTNTVVCQDTWCGTVVVGGSTFPTGYLFGNLTSGNSAAGASIVYLIEHDTLTGMLTAIDTTYSIDSAGVTAFYFPGIFPGSYLVKAAMLPTNPNYTSNIPTYHSSAIFWNQANTVNVLPNAFTVASIDFVQGINPGGPGFIGGLISQGANKGPGDPVVGVQVMLLDVNNADQPVATVYSDAAGQFGFSNIAFGTYKVYAEMLNKVTNPVIVVVDANNPNTDAIQIVVGSSLISYIDDIPGFSDANIGTPYPNPVSGVCYLPVNLENGISLTLQIQDITGRIIRTETHDLGAGQSTLSIDASTLRGGIYLIDIILPNGSVVTRRLVVK